MQTRRAVDEIGVDLPKGLETLLIFRVRSSVRSFARSLSSLRWLLPLLHAPSPLSHSFFTYTGVLGRKVIAYLVNTRSFEMQMANCVKINYTRTRARFSLGSVPARSCYVIIYTFGCEREIQPNEETRTQREYIRDENMFISVSCRILW